MKIGIDARCLAEGRRTGVEEYTLNLLLNLFEIDHKNTYVLFFNSFRPSSFDFSIFSKYPNVKIKRSSYPNKLLNFSFWYLGWPKLDRLMGGVDVVFMPNIIFGSVSKKARLILTMHDLSFERYPKYFSWKRRLWHVFINPKKLCRRADKIIAVSHSTKNDLIARYKINPKKIAVIHNGIGEKFAVVNRNAPELIQLKEKYRLPYKFILFLGTIEPRKNIIGLIRAFNRFARFAEETGNEELKKYRLVIAGSKGWLSSQIFREISLSKYKNKVRVINFVKDKEKSYLYNLASLFVYASFFEGFGFPPLEAMASGVPVIISNNSSLPEVAGEGGILIDPDKPDEIYRAIKEILLSRELREKLIKKGLENSLKFNWQKTALETLDAIDNMFPQKATRSKK